MIPVVFGDLVVVQQNRKWMMQQEREPSRWVRTSSCTPYEQAKELGLDLVGTETPTRWEELTVCCPQARRPQTSWNQQVDDDDS